MTTFWMGNEYRSVIAQKNTGLMFWTDDLLICQRHARGLQCQPFLAVDRKAGYGKLGCPFCKGGALFGKFSKHRSRKAITAALNQLAQIQ